MFVLELIRKESLRQGLRPRTIKTYQYCVNQFFRSCKKDPIYVTKMDIQDYLDHLLDKNAPGNTLNVHLNALKFFYEQVLHRKLTVNIKFSKTSKKLPHFLSQTEIQELIRAISNSKHSLMIRLLYSSGMRISELLNLKVGDLELSQNYGWVKIGRASCR